MSKSIVAAVRENAVPTVMDVTTALTPFMRRNPKFTRVVEGFMLAQATYTAFNRVRDRFKKETINWTVSVRENDDLYEAAVALMGSQDTKNWRAVEASSVYDGDDNRKVEAMPSEREERNLLIDGHKVFAFIDGLVHAGPQGQGARILKSPTVIFVSPTEAGQKAVLAALADAYEKERSERVERTPMLYTYGGWGWSRRTELLKRPVESVVVTANQVEDIVADLKNFLSLEEEYNRRGIPFHRGYLLYGPPGTGKTSAVKAVASAVGLDLYYASLSGLNGDTEITKIANDIGPKNILLLEDIDSFGAARERDEAHADSTTVGSGVTTTGLLNVLDGVDTPHGMITFMTTNHKEFLDSALIRPGRIDRQVFMGNPDDDTVARHFAYFYDREPSCTLLAAGRSGAEVNEIFVSHMHDPEGAERILSTLPEPKTEEI